MGSDYKNLVFYSICDTREAGWKRPARPQSARVVIGKTSS
jgi:hypothetical protein